MGGKSKKARRLQKSANALEAELHPGRLVERENHNKSFVSQQYFSHLYECIIEMNSELIGPCKGTKEADTRDFEVAGFLRAVTVASAESAGVTLEASDGEIHDDAHLAKVLDGTPDPVALTFEPKSASNLSPKTYQHVLACATYAYLDADPLMYVHALCAHVYIH